MITYTLDSNIPLFESLYRCIRDDILAGRLVAGEKLPSKRQLSQHLQVSKSTVEVAYGQLLAEGYIYSKEKVGYFVESVAPRPFSPAALPAEAEAPAPPAAPQDSLFPFSVWARLLRRVMADYGAKILAPLPAAGVPELRQSIARYLQGSRQLSVAPDQIVVGAGTDFLYNVLIQLLGRELRYGVEEPGFTKITAVYRANGIHPIPVPLDSDGVTVEALQSADVVHLSPAHHYPTGIITPVRRRQELLEWAGEEKWIIEDDYDSEFRFTGRPIPPMTAMDKHGRVIYINSFSKTLAPGLRISYMVLPRALMAQFKEKLGFYACTVPGFEQYTLAKFLEEGYFEKHLNRMKKHYRDRRAALLQALAPLEPQCRVVGSGGGLHFLLVLPFAPSEAQIQSLAVGGLRIQRLSHYYGGLAPEFAPRTLVADYSAGGEGTELARRLAEILKAVP